MEQVPETLKSRDLGTLTLQLAGNAGEQKSAAEPESQQAVPSAPLWHHC